MIFTIGHSTRPAEDFIEMLRAHQVVRLADIRTIPRSRHNPQFEGDTLRATLADAGIAYVHMPGLGGLRRARPDSKNLAWRNASFRGYADYMQTPEFEQALEELIRIGARENVAAMCAEAVPWRCHRSLMADALIARGLQVADIQSPTRAQPHKLTPWANVNGTSVTYPGVLEGL